MTPLFAKLVVLIFTAVPRARSARSSGGDEVVAPRGLGQACTREGLSTAGNCGVFRGEKAVQLKCYHPTVEKIAAAPPMGGKGTCYIPRGGSCTSNAQCRPGSICNWPGGDKVGLATCLELHEVFGDKINTAELVSSMADIFLGEIRSGGWSGILSSFSKLYSSARQVMRQVKLSFQTAKPKEHRNSSASGAAFWYSGDGLFIAKKLVREEEYQSMQGPLMRELRGLDLECAASPEEPPPPPHCWARAALEATLLSLPVLAFRYQEDHWAVFPVAAALRSYAKGLAPTERPYGKPKYYDVKPHGAASEQRVGLLRTLAAMDFTPRSSSYSGAAQPAQEQWKEVMGRLSQGLSTLDQSSFRPFVDYSLLFEVYTPGRPVQDPGTNCVSSRQCFEEGTSEPCHVICITIIDYFLRYDNAFKEFESFLIGNKWDNYAKKVQTLFRCLSYISQLNVPDGTQGTWTGTDLTLYKAPSKAISGLITHPLADGKPFVKYVSGPEPRADSCSKFPGARVYVRPGEVDDPEKMLTCRTYVDMACAVDVPPACTRRLLGGGGLVECAFHVQGSIADGCRARLIANCFKAVAAMER